MFAAKYYPDRLAPQELDSYLERGWYRMGQTIFTTHFLCFEAAFYSAIWVRLDLKDFSFRKSLRKKRNQNGRRFRHVIRPATISAEKERLYQRYKANFSGLLAPSLKDSLLDGEDYNIYTTYEVAIYDGNKLVGLSYFDLGEKALSSITGIYDPSYQKYSLGFYTMLLEVEFGLQERFRYYYPGYVVPGYPRFDYKLRIGPVEYFDLPTGSWTPYEKLSAEAVPLTRMSARLKELQHQLRAVDIPARIYYYPFFEANLFGFWRMPFFDYPIMIAKEVRHPENPNYYVIVFDPRTQQYQLLFCTLFDEVQFYFNESYARSFQSEEYFTELLIINHIVESSPEVSAILRAYQSASKQRSPGRGI